MTTVTTPIPQPLTMPSGIRATLARRILQAVAGRVPVEVRLPDGTSLSRQGPTTALDRPSHRPGAPGRPLSSDRRPSQDRHRRGLHGRGLATRPRAPTSRQRSCRSQNA